MRWRADGVTTGGEVARLDKGKMDLTCVESRTTRRGIYRLSGDALTIHVSPTGKADRPASFDLASEGDTVYVLRRKR